MNKEHTKNCPKCGIIQKYSTKKILFAAIKNKRRCKNCCQKKLSAKEKTLKRKISNKKWIDNNKEKIKEYKKEYNKKHKELQKQYNLQYRQTQKYKENQKTYINRYLSKEETKEKRKEYRKIYSQRKPTKEVRRLWDKKRRNNPEIRLGQSVSSSMRSSLKVKNLSKNKRHWEDMIGYTVQELKKHLESLFQPGMNWSNYGKWHIDHIIPKSFFRYKSTDDVEFRYCWSLDNLQPLWAKDNISKADRLTIIVAKKAS